MVPELLVVRKHLWLAVGTAWRFLEAKERSEPASRGRAPFWALDPMLVVVLFVAGRGFVVGGVGVRGGWSPVSSARECRACASCRLVLVFTRAAFLDPFRPALCSVLGLVKSFSGLEGRVAGSPCRRAWQEGCGAHDACISSS